MAQEDRKYDVESGDENEVAIALVAECQVGDKKYSAGETWNDDEDECRMSICNPGGVVSFLECPRFDAKEDDPSCVTIPGDNKYAYPHCCNYVFRTKEKKASGDKTEEGNEKQENEPVKDNVELINGELDVSNQNEMKEENVQNKKTDEEQEKILKEMNNDVENGIKNAKEIKSENKENCKDKKSESESEEGDDVKDETELEE